MRAIRLASLLSVAIAASSARAQDRAAVRDSLAYTTASVTVRAKPFVTAQALGKLVAGSAVRVSRCSSGWCSVTAPQLAGSVLEEYLSSQVPVLTQGPPPGASARCHDGIYSFSRSRSLTCLYHGGVAQWF